VTKIVADSRAQIAENFRHLDGKWTRRRHAVGCPLSFAAATIFIALVICCVFLTDLIRPSHI
jgi:hypothetical protein